MEIQRPETIQVEPDRAQYRAGERGNIGLKMRSANNKPLSNQNYDYRLLVDGKPAPVTQAPASSRLGNGNKSGVGQHFQQGQAGGTQYAPMQTGKTDALGNANLQFELPQNVYSNALIELSTNVGKKKETVVQPIPVVPSEATIDFFPEGGDLVAGLASKVYYRVRSALGDPIDPEGHVIILTEHEVLHDSERGKGTGCFTCTPALDQEYVARITGPGGVTEIKNPFKKLGIKKDGHTLHLANAVAKEGEPVNAVVRSTQADRRLLLSLTCRGQVVQQEFLTAQAGDNPVNLTIEPSLQGVLRLTLYELSGERPRPVAERLLYRGVSRKLDVAVTQRGEAKLADAKLGEARLQPNTKGVGCEVKVKDESGTLRPAWMLAAVVDDRFRAERHETSLPSFFYLASEMGGEDLEDMPLVLGDSPQAFHALDLFLGTTGWRRFVPAEQAPQLALGGKHNRPADSKKDAQGKEEEKAQKAPEPAALTTVFFSTENQPRALLKQKTQTKSQSDLDHLRQEANRQRAELLTERERLAGLTTVAQELLDEFEQRWSYHLRQAYWALIFAITAVGGLCLLATLYSLSRRRRNAPALIGAFSCLALALVLFQSGRSVAILHGAPTQQAGAKLTPWPELLIQDNQRQPVGKPVPAPPVGLFAAAPAEQRKQPAPAIARDVLRAMLDQFAKADAKDDAQVNLQNEQNLQKLLTQNSAANLREGPGEMLARRHWVNKELQDRFQKAAENQDRFTRGGPVAPSTPALPAATTNPLITPGPTPPPVTPAKGPDPKGPDVHVNPTPPVVPVGPLPTLPTDPRNGGDKRTDKDANLDMVRLYAHHAPKRPVDLQDTLLWHPNLFTQNGKAEISFDLSGNLTTYRVLIYANGPDGRLGFYEGRLDVNKR